MYPQIKALLIFHSPKGNAETVFFPSVITTWVFLRPHWGIRYSSPSAVSPLIQGATPMWYMSSAAQSTKGTAGFLSVACSVAFASHITPSFLRKAQFCFSIRQPQLYGRLAPGLGNEPWSVQANKVIPLPLLVMAWDAILTSKTYG